jgi:hypothetical protein
MSRIFRDKIYLNDCHVKLIDQGQILFLNLDRKKGFGLVAGIATDTGSRGVDNR